MSVGMFVPEDVVDDLNAETEALTEQINDLCENHQLVVCFGSFINLIGRSIAQAPVDMQLQMTMAIQELTEFLKQDQQNDQSMTRN